MTGNPLTKPLKDKASALAGLAEIPASVGASSSGPASALSVSSSDIPAGGLSAIDLTGAEALTGSGLETAGAAALGDQTVAVTTQSRVQKRGIVTHHPDPAPAKSKSLLDKVVARVAPGKAAADAEKAAKEAAEAAYWKNEFLRVQAQASQLKKVSSYAEMVLPDAPAVRGGPRWARDFSSAGAGAGAGAGSSAALRDADALDAGESLRSQGPFTSHAFGSAGSGSGVSVVPVTSLASVSAAEGLAGPQKSGFAFLGSWRRGKGASSVSGPGSGASGKPSRRAGLPFDEL